MHPLEIETALENITLFMDSREQPTARAKKRLETIGFPYIRKKLDFGDYSAKCAINGKELDFSSSFAIERKMNIDEICGCFCRSRERFSREFERAKTQNAKLYLLIENASWEKIYNGKYRSQMSPNSLTASILAFLARYNCQIVFCKEETSGKLIHDIVYREIKERLEQRAEK